MKKMQTLPLHAVPSPGNPKQAGFNTKRLSLSRQVRKQPKLLVLLGWVVLTTLVALTQTAFAYQDQTKQSSATPKDNKPNQTAFTYQGQLKEGSVPANGTYTFRFALHTGQSGDQKLGVVIKDDVVVTNGSFTVQLDFGTDGISSNESWLEAGVRTANSAGPYTALSPRQRLTPTPYAILAQAEPWSLIGVPVGFPRGVDTDLVPDKIADHSLTSEKIADGQVVKSVNSIKDHLTLAAGNNVTITPSGNTLTIASQESSIWVKDGTTARLSTGTDKVGIGTTKPRAKLDVAGDIHASDAVTVGNSVGLLSSPTVNLIEVDDPNPLAIGFSNPFSTTPNPVTFSNIQVGIGTLSPTATLHINGTTRFSGIATLDDSASVQLRAEASGGARILGEQGDTPARPAIGFFSTNGVDDGGGGNGIFRPTANEMAFATASTERMRINSGGNVGIGTTGPSQRLDVNGQARIRVLTSNPSLNNVVVANPNGVLFTRPASTLGGGNFWSLTGNAVGPGAFLGTTNGVPLRVFTNSTEKMRILANGNVGIGTPIPTNRLDVNGQARIRVLTFNPSLNDVVVANSNGVLFTRPASTLGGGGNFWSLTGNAATSGNFLGTTVNFPLEIRVNNSRALLIEHHPQAPNIIGGSPANSVTAGVGGATISGGGFAGAAGNGNTVTANFGTVGGGRKNQAGSLATVGGGFVNTASGPNSTVSGGANNTASGSGATVPGGSVNTAAGNGSFAAGCQAQANHNGAFVWAHVQGCGNPFVSTAADEFNVRASGGTRFFSDPAASVGVQLFPGNNSWSFMSDRNIKENFQHVEGRLILQKLSFIPITKWNLKSQDPSIKHFGPMAQDFYASFGLGESDRHISTTDADGIALVSIQALYEMSLEKDKKIQELQQRIEKLENLVGTMMKKQENRD